MRATQAVRPVHRAFLVALLLGASLLWGARTGRAAFTEWLLDGGGSMLSLAGAHTAGIRELRVNGARFRVATVRSTHSVETLADQYAASCRSHSGGMDRGWGHPEAARALGDFAGVLHVTGDGTAMVACLDQGTKGDAEQFVHRLARFTDTLDLSELGGIRMARLERSGDGTFAVALWSEGPLSLPRMFPTTGDAPGVDPPGVPRPEDSRRVLSAWQSRRAPSIASYYLSMGSEQATAYYTRELSARGFRVDAPSPGALLARREGAQLVVSITPRGRQSVVSLLSVDDRSITLR